MLAFIDVSGDPFSLPQNSPWIATHTLCIKKRSIYDITATMHRLKRDLLDNEYLEIKSTDLVNKSTLNHPELAKARYLQSVVDLCLNHCDCRHASVVFKNSGKNRKSGNGHLPKHYVDSLWRVEAIARDWGVKDVLVIIDNNTRKTDKNLAFSFNNYIYRSNGGDLLANILPVPLFADSETTTGLQLADIAAGIMRNYYSRIGQTIDEHDDDYYFYQKVKGYYEIIKARSIDRRVASFPVTGIFCPPNIYIV